MNQAVVATGITIDDPETERLARELAGQRSVNLAEAIKLAVSEALETEQRAQVRLSGIRSLRKELAGIPRTGLQADKVFYDSLNDE